MVSHPRILIACDKFKGSLSAAEACEAIRRGLAAAWPAAEIHCHPIADGGEGFAAALAAQLGGSWVETRAHDALGRPVEARYLVAETAGERVAVIEMAEASGIWRIAPEERAVTRANTRGTGEMMRHAVEQSGATRLIVGLGGSATNDGGAGMAGALGVRLLAADGGEIDPFPAAWRGRLARIDISGRIVLPPVTAACDVSSPLLGPEGATRVFGPQKGAGPDDIPLLEDALAELARCAGDPSLADRPGSGAAGGLGFGLMAFAGASLVPGFTLMADLSGLGELVAKADLVVTGEGSLDSQSLAGKGPVGLAELARAHGIPVTAFCGRADGDIRGGGVFTNVFELRSSGLPEAELMANAAGLLERAAREAAQGGGVL